jgi:hypothetical protein
VPSEKEKLSELVDGGGKTMIKKNADCIVRNYEL